VVWVVCAVVLLNVSLLIITKDASGYTLRPAIYIEGNSNFTPGNGVVSGSGTSMDPYIISGWEILATPNDGIEIRDTDNHFIIRDSYVHTGVGWINIYLYNVSNARVENVIVEDNLYGLHVAPCNNVSITNVTSRNHYRGLRIANCENVWVENSEFSNNAKGIEITSSNSTTIVSTKVENSLEYGIDLYLTTNVTMFNNTLISDGMYIMGWNGPQISSHTIPLNNTVNGRPIRYHKDCTGLDLDGIPTGQALIMNCTSVSLANLWLNNSDIGVEVLYSDLVQISELTVSNEMYGMFMYAENVTLDNNTIRNATEIGIELSGVNLQVDGNDFYENGIGLRGFWATSLQATRNRFEYNGVGLSLQSTSATRVFHNNFMFNTVSATDDSGPVNQWDDGYPSGGNYWDDYTGVDLCSGPNQDMCPDPDGIGDTNYTIDANSKDRYPLMDPVPVTESETTPPDITNIQPPDSSTTNDNTPTIGAEYDDFSGIDVSSVLLEVDGADVTLSATVTTSGVTYVPTVPLPDGVHIVYLEVRDSSPDSNLATESWSFTVNTSVPDITPPLITNLQPSNTSTVNDSTPTMGGDYSDVSGIDASSVVLEVDGVDMTSSATVTTTGVTYNPTTPLSDGLHEIYLEVRDSSVDQNMATKVWSFTVDTQIPDKAPPTISNLQPPDGSSTDDSTQTISAEFEDPSGIDVSSVLIKVDGGDVTSSATITSTGVSYTPTTPLSEGAHDVYLEVKDNSSNHNKAMESWSFNIELEGEDEPEDWLEDALPWIILVVLIVLVLMVVFFVLLRRRKPEESEEEEIQEPEE
jgi:parallel beta-helix repeat protein